MEHEATIEKMIKSILGIINKTIKNHEENNRIFKARIIEKVDYKKYKILYCGRILTVTSGIPYEVGDFVRVCVSGGNWEDLFVVCKA